MLLGRRRQRLHDVDVALAAVLPAALPQMSPASAHHQFLRQSFPGPNNRVAPVSEVKLVFEGKADALFSTLKVKMIDGTLVAEMTQPRASQEMVLSTPRLAPGEYVVEYRVLASDGDVVKGGYFFTVDNRAVGIEKAG